MDSATGNERQWTGGMVERTVGVLTMSEVSDGRAGQRHEPADSDMVKRNRALKYFVWNHFVTKTANVALISVSGH